MVLFKTVVKPFYNENAGLFIFLIIVMFCIVNKVDGAAVLEYHYSLIRGMLTSPVFLAIVFAGWALYARKFTAWVTASLRSPVMQCMQVLNILSRTRRMLLLLFVEAAMLTPVWLYAACMIVIGLKLHFYAAAVSVLFSIAALSLIPAAMHLEVLSDTETDARKSGKKIGGGASYISVLLRAVWSGQKIFLLALKLFTCGIIFLVARNNSATDYDTSFPFLFFDLGILAHAMLLFRLGRLEAQQLLFYRGLPVPLINRLGSYASASLIILLPEWITLAALVPVHLHAADAAGFAVAAFSSVLLMNSLRFIPGSTMKDFLKILMLVFCIQLAFLLTAGLFALSLVLLALAVWVFVKNYYRFYSLA